MFAARVAVATLRCQGSQSLLKLQSGKPISKSVTLNLVRDFRTTGKDMARGSRIDPLQQSSGILRKPAVLEIGEMVAAGAGAVGLGALCFYGLGLSNKPGAVEKMYVWPQYVKDRIRTTYTYFGASVVAVAGSAVAFYRSPMSIKFSNVCARHPILSTIGILAAVIGSGQAMMTIPYEPGFGSKQLMWLVNCGVLGVALSPICMVGGALAVRAAWYTAGLCGGLSAISVCAPSEKFLNWAGPLGMGLGGVVIASLGSAFLPPTSRLGLGLYSISLYGGLILFSCFLLYDTQKIIKSAETHPNFAMRSYDPINHSHRIVMDTLNIFVRIVQILAMGGANRKK